MADKYELLKIELDVILNVVNCSHGKAMLDGYRDGFDLLLNGNPGVNGIAFSTFIAALPLLLREPDIEILIDGLVFEYTGFLSLEQLKVSGGN